MSTYTVTYLFACAAGFRVVVNVCQVAIQLAIANATFTILVQQRSMSSVLKIYEYLYSQRLHTLLCPKTKLC